jgi:uncharacterized protein DUF4388
MELTGDLSDFALTDILQILALSRKTGTLSLENGNMAGRIIIEQGRITHASLYPGDSLADCMVSMEMLTPEMLKKLRQMVGQSGSMWTFDTLLLESGLLTKEEIATAARKHIQQVVAKLVALEKGRFGIELNQAELSRSFEDMKLLDGLDVGEVLLEAAKEKDEWHNEQEFSPDEPGHSAEAGGRGAFSFGSMPPIPPFIDPNHPMQPATDLTDDGSSREAGELLAGDVPEVVEPPEADSSAKTALLCSMLAELRFHSFEAEVSLLIMRYASEVATRGILFVVKDRELWGLGQFGLRSTQDGKSADELVREMRVPLEIDTIFSRVVRTGDPFIGPMPHDWSDSAIFDTIGHATDEVTMFALPLVCNDVPVFVIYGDNYPGKAGLRGINELVALVNQASIVMEKIVLKRRVMQIEENYAMA